MKLVKDGVIVIENNPVCVSVWLRSGFVEVADEVEDAEVSFTDMKRIAKENGINSYGMKKDELAEAIKEFI
jgi:predicted double-glycine peptidase